VKSLQESIQQLQKASESLSRLQVDPKHPGPALSQLHQILDARYWECLAEVSKHAHLPTGQQAEELQTRVKKGKKRRAQDMEPIAAGGAGFFPSTDVFQTDRLVILCCELPGFARDSLQLTLLEDQLIEVRGQIREHVHAPFRTSRERSCGTFCRRIRLPVPVSGKGFKAQYQDGLLELYLVREDTAGGKRADDPGEM
jgi:HSP20 family molecular chaperone IbpA